MKLLQLVRKRGVRSTARLTARFFQYLVPVAAVALVALLMLFDPPLMRTMKHALWDQYQRMEPRDFVDTPVRVVDVDEASLARIGQWPWSRTRLAELVEQLDANGAAVVGFDVVFAEPDRTSPQTVSAQWPLNPALRQQISQLPNHDQVFADSMRQRPVVLGFSLERRTNAPVVPTTTMPVTPHVVMGESVYPSLHPFTSVVEPLPLFSQAAAGNGALTFVPDDDGVVRRVPLVLRVGEQLMPTLVTEVLRVGVGAQNVLVRMSPTPNTGVAEVRVGPMAIPTTPSAEAWVHYTQREPQRTIPAWKVLAGEVDRSEIEGRVILVGSSAQGLMDLRFSPLGGVIPGVEAHAQMLEQILTDTYLYRPAWAYGAEALALVGLGVTVGWLVLHAGGVLSLVFMVTVVFGTLWAGWRAFVEHQLLLDTLTPALGIFLSFLLSSTIHHFTSERQQRWVCEAFSRYVSPNLVSHIVENPDELELGGRRQECSFVFTDLAGFTTLMEKIEPTEAVALLNHYLDEMIAIAFAHQGTLDRIVGDAVAIMFSAPVRQEDHQRRAYHCALAMQRYATRYTEELQAKGIPFGHTRVGVHAGDVIVGNFGGSTIFDYRALGDPVNTAARLESVNKHLGTRVCVSETIIAHCPEASVRRVGRITLKGKSRALLVYQPLNNGLDEVPTFQPTRSSLLLVERPAEEGQSRPQARRDEAYELAYDLMVQGDPGALAAFEGLAAARPTDSLVRLHLRRLQAGEPADLIVMSEK